MFFPGQFARGAPVRWPRRLSLRRPHLPSVTVDRRAVACGVATTVLVVEAAFGLWLASRKRLAAETVGRAEEDARRITRDAERDAETRKKEALLDAKEKAHEILMEAERQARQDRLQATTLEQALVRRETLAAERQVSIERHEKELSSRDRALSCPRADEFAAYAAEHPSGGMPYGMARLTDEEYRIIRPDGRVRWIRDRAFPIKDKSGRVYRVTGIAEDITERKLAEEELRATTEQLRALSARLQSAREEEATRIAREIHDELGGALTSLRWDLDDINELVSETGSQLDLQDRGADAICSRRSARRRLGARAARRSARVRARAWRWDRRAGPRRCAAPGRRPAARAFRC